MNILARPGFPTTWLTCIGLLLAVFALEIMPAHRREQRSAAVLVSPRRDVVVPVKRRPGDDSVVVLARPLFSVHRRPAREIAKSGAAQAMVGPRLSGIIVAARYRRALFESDGRLQTGGVGDHVGPYSILAITSRQVTVAGPAGIQELTIGFSAKQAFPAPTGPSILDRLRSQHVRRPTLPSSQALSQLLLQQQQRGRAPP